MTLYNWVLKDNTGTPLAYLPPEMWLYFEYTRRRNQVGRCEGVYSPSIYPDLMTLFDVRAQSGQVDYFLDVYRKPDDLPGMATTSWRRDERFMVRYNRDEMLIDGRRRVTIIGRTSNHLLERCIVHPEGSIPPVGDDPATFYAAFPWLLPTRDTYAGLPQTALGSSTAEKLRALFLRARTTNPGVLPVASTGAAGVLVGGIPDHRIDERYTTLIEALQDASASSWFASFYGLMGASPDQGCDFEMVPANTNTGLPWTFTVRVNGTADHRIGTASPVVFSSRLNNLIQPVVVVDRLDEKNQIVVGGANDGRDRDVLIVRDFNHYNQSPWNNVEDWIDSRRIPGFQTRERMIGCTIVTATSVRVQFDNNDGYFGNCGLGDSVTVTGKDEKLVRTGTISVVHSAGSPADITIQFGLATDCTFDGGLDGGYITYFCPPTGIDRAVSDGLRRLKNHGIRNDFTFIVNKNAWTRYGVEFDLGYLVSAEDVQGNIGNFVVNEVNVLVGGDVTERIGVEVATLDGGDFKSRDSLEEGFNLFIQLKKEALQTRRSVNDLAKSQ